jgi:phosphoribosylformylglycinamidine synthase
MLDLVAERNLQDFLREASESRIIRSAHDVAQGGIAAALAECCIASGLGAVIGVEADFGAAEFFAEPQSYVVVTCIKETYGDVLALALGCTLGIFMTGRVGGDRLQWGSIDATVDEMRTAYESGLPRALEGITANA